MAEPWTTARGYLHCRVCGREVSATAGTIFEGTRISLRTWFSAMWFVTSQKDGASALGIKRVLGLGSYQTAWAWLHKLRRAMVRPGRDRLGGQIEVDETYVGGSEKGGKRGRGAGRKEIVVIAVELHAPKGFGRVRMRRVPDVAGTSLVPFICDVAEKGSEILTDGWGGYNRVANYGYTHNRVILSDTGDPAHVSMPGVHRLAALLKRWLLSTHQGSVSGKHLDYYLDEYTFRFNRRASRSRGLLFYRLLQQAVATAPSPYRQIVGHDPNM
jgi:transposase-like protein